MPARPWLLAGLALLALFDAWLAWFGARIGQDFAWWLLGIAGALAGLALVLARPARARPALVLALGAHALMRISFAAVASWGTYNGILAVVLAAALAWAAMAAWQRSPSLRLALGAAAIVVALMLARNVLLGQDEAALRQAVHLAAWVALSWDAREAADAPTPPALQEGRAF